VRGSSGTGVQHHFSAIAACPRACALGAFQITACIPRVITGSHPRVRGVVSNARGP